MPQPPENKLIGLVRNTTEGRLIELKTLIDNLDDDIEAIKSELDTKTLEPDAEKLKRDAVIALNNNLEKALKEQEAIIKSSGGAMPARKTREIKKTEPVVIESTPTFEDTSKREAQAELEKIQSDKASEIKKLQGKKTEAINLLIEMGQDPLKEGFAAEEVAKADEKKIFDQMLMQLLEDRRELAEMKKKAQELMEIIQKKREAEPKSANSYKNGDILNNNDISIAEPMGRLAFKEDIHGKPNIVELVSMDGRTVINSKSYEDFIRTPDAEIAALFK